MSGIPVIRGVFTWKLSGNLVSNTEIDGFRIVPRDCIITAIFVSQGQRGNNGNTEIDINLFSPTKPIATARFGTAGSTIYTTQANRPMIAGSTPNKTDNAVLEAVLPDIVDLVEGDFLSMDIDNSVAQSKDLCVQVYYRIKP